MTRSAVWSVGVFAVIIALSGSAAADERQDGAKPAATVVHMQLQLGEQWAVGSSTTLSSTFAVSSAITVSRRLYVEGDVAGVAVAGAIGAVVRFPVTDSSSDFVQLLVSGGMAIAAHSLVQLEVAALLGPSMELFSDVFFGNGARIGLVVGGRLDVQILMAHADDAPYFVISGSGLGYATTPEHLSWNIALGVGGAFGRVRRDME